jgi:hypothetical protein
MQRLKAILLLTATFAFVVASYTARNFRGYEPSDFPVPYQDPPIQPAGWAFAIWGLIYLWLILHAGYGLLKRADDTGWDAPRWPLMVSVALGASWLAVAQIAPVWATVQIWIMWAGAVIALAYAPKRREHWLLSAPVGLYAGWLTAAAGVATGVVLLGYGIMSQTGSALAMLAVIAAIALAVTRLMVPPVTYPAGVIWALIGVIAANGAAMPLIAGAAAVAALILAASAWPLLTSQKR